MPKRAPNSPPANTPESATPDWKEPCSNKKQKKRVLQGEQEQGSAKASPSRTPTVAETASEDTPHALLSLKECFAEIPDPRVNRRRRHLLIDIIVIAVCAVIANADTWKDMQTWAEEKQTWLAQFLELPGGVPSRDTLRRTISRLDPDMFQQCFFDWLGGLRKDVGGLIAIDGKTLRRSKDGDQPALHIVSAWSAEQHLTLGQQTVDGKSNEITAIPKLLNMLNIQGAVVTIDAMGCQKAIAAQIVDRKGDYCLAVKDNQPTLAEDVETALWARMKLECEDPSVKDIQIQEFEQFDKGHGRQEERYYYTMPVPDTLRTADEWKGLQSIGMAIRYWEGNSEGEVRYFINSFACDSQRFAKAVRGHWGIENSLHWVMDVTFREDESRIRKDHGGENVSWLRRLAISIIKQDASRKDSIRSKRIRAGYNVQYLAQILDGLKTEN